MIYKPNIKHSEFLKDYQNAETGNDEHVDHKERGEINFSREKVPEIEGYPLRKVAGRILPSY